MSSGSNAAPGTSPATVQKQVDWMTKAEEEAEDNDLNLLLTETKANVEKLAAGHMKMGSWQMVLWQPRWLFADLEAVMYQKINKEGKPFGRVKRVPFAQIKAIHELECREFVLQTEKRDYTFKGMTYEGARALVGNLRELKKLAAEHAAPGSPSGLGGSSKSRRSKSGRRLPEGSSK